MRKLYSSIIVVFAVVGLGFFVEETPTTNSPAEARFKSKKKVPELTKSLQASIQI